MYMIEVKSKQDVENLKIFLNRVELKGSESIPHATLLLACNEAKEIPIGSSFIPGIVGAEAGAAENEILMKKDGNDGKKDN